MKTLARNGMGQTNLHNEIFERVVEVHRERQKDFENSPTISRDELRWDYYAAVVDECAKTVDHIKIWDSTLGDHIRRKMKVL